MSSPVIPKEQLSAYQRWELDSFDAKEPEPTIKLPTLEEIEHIQNQAYMEGFEVGRQKGIEQGIVEISGQVEHIKTFLANVKTAIDGIEEEISRDILSLSLAIAGQVLRQAIQVKQELLLPVIREAIHQLPPFNQHAHLVLHPEDAPMVREKMGEQLAHTGWKIIEDFRIEKGGCRIETGTSQVDATLETRWKKVVSAISEHSDWIEES